MKIAIVVHGRWDAFDLARELDRRDHQVTLLTNYPAWAVKRWGVPASAVRSFWPHGVLTRLIARYGGPGVVRRAESVTHQAFGRWASLALRHQSVDVVYAFSGIAEESLTALRGRVPLRVLVRESAHIRTQDRLLREEQERTGAPQDRPSKWMIAREEREYALADTIRVLSTFARQSFLAEGVDPEKVRLVLSGVELASFRAADSTLARRVQRIRSGAPLRVLNVGTFAFRKGMWDMASVVQELGVNGFDFRFVGPVADEARSLAKHLQAWATFVPKQPQAALPAAYAWGDVFMLPTIEDGFAAVLAQAAAAGLPILTTPNGAGGDLVQNDQSGWILPIRSPRAFVDRLHWIDSHRTAVADMVGDIHRRFRPRDFGEVVVELEHMCAEFLSEQPRVAVLAS